MRILVTDNGKGLTPAERRRVFLPGYSTKRKGWGLGLALARRIVEEYHKGKLSVGWSEVGQGHDVRDHASHHLRHQAARRTGATPVADNRKAATDGSNSTEDPLGRR